MLIRASLNGTHFNAAKCVTSILPFSNPHDDVWSRWEKMAPTEQWLPDILDRREAAARLTQGAVRIYTHPDHPTGTCYPLLPSGPHLQLLGMADPPAVGPGNKR